MNEISKWTSSFLTAASRVEKPEVTESTHSVGVKQAETDKETLAKIGAQKDHIQKS